MITLAPTELRPFTVAVPEAELDDLRQRLSRTRWPSEETVPDWSQGVRTSGRRTRALPLQLTHGWPESVADYLPLIGPLTDPEAFGAGTRRTPSTSPSPRCRGSASPGRPPGRGGPSSAPRAPGWG